MRLDFWKSLGPVLAMGIVILVSNELVQHPIQGFFLGIDLSLVLTWGAFTYPVAFLITDTTNRLLAWDLLGGLSQSVSLLA